MDKISKEVVLGVEHEEQFDTFSDVEPGTFFYGRDGRLMVKLDWYQAWFPKEKMFGRPDLDEPVQPVGVTIVAKVAFRGERP
jgi:hypothetical protein